jgi:hypothetical protein
MQTPFEITNAAVEQVKENNKTYHDDLLIFATSWVKTQFRAFSSEDLKKAYYDKGNEEPAEPRVFGAIFRALSKDGFIFKHGFELSSNPKCHSRPQQLWISFEYRAKQQKNRSIVDPGFNLFQSAS